MAVKLIWLFTQPLVITLIVLWLYTQIYLGTGDLYCVLTMPISSYNLIRSHFFSLSAARQLLARLFLEEEIA